jgi:hypothetical protein
MLVEIKYIVNHTRERQFRQILAFGGVWIIFYGCKTKLNWLDFYCKWEISVLLKYVK